MLRLRVVTTATRPLLRRNATLASADATVPTPPPPPPVAPKAEKPAKPAAASGSGKAASKSADTKAGAKKGSEKAAEEAEEDPNRPNVRPRRVPARRRNLNLHKPAEWNRPLAPGVLPAYDEALRVIKADSRAIKAQLEQVNARIEKAGEDGDLAELKEKAHILEVQSEINLPDVRWKFRNKMGKLRFPCVQIG